MTVGSTVLSIVGKLLFLLFIIYANNKLHWFDHMQYDDVKQWNVK